MIYTIIYGLLALATASIAIASRNKSVWKLGLIFFSNWVATISIYFLASATFEAALSLATDLLSAVFCYLIADIYKCKVSRAVMFIYGIQAGLYGYILSAGDPFFAHVSLNALFVTNALIIISNSIKLLLSKDRRWHDVKCVKNDRRINSRKHNMEMPYAQLN